MGKTFISKNLSQARENAGYSIENLAELIDSDADSIMHWENGEQEPDITQVLLLSRLYGLSVEEMFVGFDEKDILAKEKIDNFSHNSWINRISNRKHIF